MQLLAKTGALVMQLFYLPSEIPVKNQEKIYRHKWYRGKNNNVEEGGETQAALYQAERAQAAKPRIKLRIEI